MKRINKKLAIVLTLALILSTLPVGAISASAANPFLPLWERIPDGEPRVFTDPATGEQRLYVYGSHDSRISGYCGPDHVVWSAPVDDPNNWRQEGTAFHVNQLNGVPYVDSDGVQKQLIVDVAPIPGFTDSLGVTHQGSTAANSRVALYAPDVVYHPENNKYYMYLFVDGMWHVNPNSTGTPPQRRHLMFVASSNSPAGPFTSPKFVTLAFDPAVLVDDVKNASGKSRVYLYWTPEESRNLYAAELDPNDMATILPNTTHYPFGVTAQAPNNTMPDWTAPFHMFEGSSIRKVGSTYLLAYCRGERTTWNATSNISEIGWAYSDNPFGDPALGDPWTYGGVVVSNKGEFITNPYTGVPNTATFNGGNIHGGMMEVGGQWYQIYHRSTGISSKRQAMAEPFDLTFDSSGNPVIEQVEMTSKGFETDGLDPFEEQYAGYACYTIPASGGSAPTFFSQNNDSTINFDPNATRDDWYPVQNLRNQSWLGYKYFNFGSGVELGADEKLKLVLTLQNSTAGAVNIYVNDAKARFSDPEQPKTSIGAIEFNEVNSEVHTVEGYVSAAALTGEKGLYLEFLSSASGEICKVNKLKFEVEKLFVPVTDITAVPANATAGTALTLFGNVVPANATNKTIAWSVKSAGSTGAKISGSTFNATAPGTAIVTATVANGSAVGTAYTKDFTIIVKDSSGNDKDIPGDDKVKDTFTETPVPYDKIPQATQPSAPGAAVELPKTITFPNGTQSDVTWSSADSKVAKTDSTGRLVGVSEGKVTLTATSKTNPALKYTFTVTIAKNVTKVRTPLTKLYLKKGKSLKPPVCADSVNVLTKKADTSAKLTWKSSNVKVATVNSVTGKISPKKKGKATITATALNGKKLTLKVFVVSKSKSLSKVSLSKAPKSLKVGKAAILKVKASSAKATNLLVKFKSSKRSVIKVDKAGKITALKKGKAKITVTIGKKKISRTITVK